ncbi:hypothetical protein D3C86_1272360 [compost metagenome]
MVFVARGLVGPPHRPVRLRSDRKTIECGLPDKPHSMVLGRLRRPTGASPLATMIALSCYPCAKSPPERTHGPSQPPFTLPFPHLATPANPRQCRARPDRRPQRRDPRVAAIHCLRTDRRPATGIRPVRRNHPRSDRLPLGFVVAFDLRSYGRHLHCPVCQRQSSGRSSVAGLRHADPVADVSCRHLSVAAGFAAVRRAGEFRLALGGTRLHPGCCRGDCHRSIA